jgi:hypothetical protein
MSGSFGFTSGTHYDVSVKVANMVLVPAVRKASTDTLVMADGFSCREQIAQLTDRRALHLAQVLNMAMREGPAGPRGAYPERRYVRPRVFHKLASRYERMFLFGLGAAIGGSLLMQGAAQHR